MEEINNNPIENISVNIINENNLFEWECKLIAPKNSPYSGGVFTLKIKFPDDYPNKTPEVVFIIPIYHINVNPTKEGDPLGNVYISSLNNWKSESKIKEVLLDVYDLFYKEDTLSPYGLDRVDELRCNRVLYEKKIRYFTKKYASTNIINKNNENSWDFSYS